MNFRSVLAWWVFAAWLGSACAAQPPQALDVPRASEFVEDLFVAGSAIEPNDAGEVDFLQLCRFAQSDSSCRKIGRTLVSGVPADVDASIACVHQVNPTQVVVVVEAWALRNDDPIITPLSLHLDRGVIAARHPFYWSGIGLAMPTDVRKSEKGVTADTHLSASPTSLEAWCPAEGLAD